MKEAFDTMSSHPMVTLFLGAILVVSLYIVFDSIAEIFKKK